MNGIDDIKWSLVARKSVQGTSGQVRLKSESSAKAKILNFKMQILRVLFNFKVNILFVLRSRYNSILRSRYYSFLDQDAILS